MSRSHRAPGEPDPREAAPPPGGDAPPAAELDALASCLDDTLAADEPADESAAPDAKGAPDELPDHRRIAVRNDVRKRLDVYLQNRLKGISRSRVQKLIDLGGVTVNDRAPKASTVIKAGDVIDIILPAQGVRRIEPEPIPLDVLYEDEHFIVLNKQAGLIVHPARSHLSGTLLNALAHRFRERAASEGRAWRAHTTRGFSKQAGVNPIDEGTIEGLSGVGAEEFRPGIIHRLDKNTTGVMVVGKSDEAHWGIARQFEQRRTLKAYLAVVHGNPDAAGGAVEQPIGKHPTIREAMSIRHDSAGRHALTLYRVREQYRGYALVELEIKTGRTHQIRVHLAHLGHPLVGDILYGGELIGAAELDAPPPLRVRRYIAFARDKAEGQRLEAAALARADILMAHPALHAALLRFTHPVTNEEMTFTAPLHEPLVTLVRELRQRSAEGLVATSGYWIDLASMARGC